MKAIIGGKIHKGHTAEIKKLSIVIEIEDPELIDHVIKKNGMTLYTEKEYRDLKARISAALSVVNRMSTGNFSHHISNLKAILGGIK